MSFASLGAEINEPAAKKVKIVDPTEQDPDVVVDDDIATDPVVGSHRPGASSGPALPPTDAGSSGGAVACMDDTQGDVVCDDHDITELFGPVPAFMRGCPVKLVHSKGTKSHTCHQRLRVCCPHSWTM